MSEEAPRARVRELGLHLGHYEPGPFNAITDVPGVRVGHATIVRGSGKLEVGKGPVRTGVTAILPTGGNTFMDRPMGGGFVLNGAGEVSGLTQVLEWGLIETPIVLTNTLAVGACSEGVVRYMVGKYPGIGEEHDVVIPLVGECDDSWLNDIAGRHVTAEHVMQAIESAQGGPVEEGNVGAGTGMVTCDFAGGIGTSSRHLPDDEGGYTLGVLVMSNFGRMIDLRMDGIPVGELLAPRFMDRKKRRSIYGSIIAVCATDAPLLPHQLGRLSKRIGLGIGRVGSYAAHGSGEIVISFTTTNTVKRAARKRVQKIAVLSDEAMDPLYKAVIEATEEAILNALCMAREMEGVNGNVAPAVPLDELRAIFARFEPPHVKGEPPPLRDKDDYAGPLDQVALELKRPHKRRAAAKKPDLGE